MSDYFYIQSQLNQLVLTIDGFKNNVYLCMYPAYGGANQLWKWGSDDTLVSKMGLLMDTSEDNTSVISYVPGDLPAEKWQYENDAIKNKQSNLVIDITETTDIAAIVPLAEETSSLGQKWTLVRESKEISNFQMGDKNLELESVPESGKKISTRQMGDKNLEHESVPESGKKSPFGPFIGLLGQIGQSVIIHTKLQSTNIQKNWKLSLFITVLVAAVGSLVSHYSQSGSTVPDAPPNLQLSSLTKPWFQRENDRTNYDFGVRMDPQIRDCSSDVHWKTTFSDLDYSLLGYDILFGYPLSNGRDPGFRHPIFRANFSKPKQTSDCRYVVPQGFTVIPSESCTVSFQSNLIRNKQQMSSHLGVQASVHGGGWGFEFSASAGYKKDTAEMSTGEYLFVISQAECHNYYSMIDFSNPPPFDAGFLEKAKTLADPKVSDEAVQEFINYYGTHFFTEVTFGAKFVQHHKMNQTSYEHLEKNQISVEAQASYSGLISIGGGFSLDKEQSKAASDFSKFVETTTYTVGSTPPSNGDAMTWAASVDQNPVPMLYSLAAIDILFTEPFTKDLPPGVDYAAIRKKLANVSHIYCQSLRSRGMVHSCEARFQLVSEGVDINEPGYSSLENVDNSTCLAFCRQDPNCTSVVYSELLSNFTSSICRFFNTRETNLTLIDPLLSKPKRRSDLIILESRVKGYYLNAALEGAPFLVEMDVDKNTCDWHCSHGTSGFFCDAYSYTRETASTGSCSLYSSKDVKKIFLSNNSTSRL